MTKIIQMSVDELDILISAAASHPDKFGTFTKLWSACYGEDGTPGEYSRYGIKILAVFLNGIMLGDSDKDITNHILAFSQSETQRET